MPVNYNVDIKNARMTAVRDKIDAGPAKGSMQIGTAGMALVLTTIEFLEQCGTVANGTLTFATPISDFAADAGTESTAAAARILDGNGTAVITGLTVGLSTDIPVPDVILDSVVITQGQTVTINSAAINHA